METHSRKPPSSQSAKAALTPAQQRWVTTTLQRLSLREKVAQMLMINCFGVFMPAESAEYRDLAHQVAENHAGGIMLGAKTGPLGVENSQAYPSAAIINDLQRRAAIPLLVSADFEQGAGMRVTEGTHFPSAMAVAAAGRPEDAYEIGRITALESRAIGVNWIFAPVADVNVNAENPIINIRSFGENPAAVSDFVAAFVRGAEDNGALATAKHFPGHGDVIRDSHLELPTLAANRNRLESVEWLPFRAAITAGVGAIMTGHLAVPAIEPDPNVPATLSPLVLQSVLRGELGFNGLIVADALDMGGVASLYSPPEAAVRAAIAGVDVLLLPPNPSATLAALVAAVETGRLPQSRVDDAVRRILSAKARLLLAQTPASSHEGGASTQSDRHASADSAIQVDLAALPGALQRPDYTTAAQDIAERGVTLLRNGRNLIPLDATRPSRALLLNLSGDPDSYPGEVFEKELHQRVDSLTVIRIDTKFSLMRALQLPSPDSYDLTIVAIFVRVADRKGTVALPEDQAALLHKLLEGEEDVAKPVIVACFGNPYLLEHFSEAHTWIAAFSSVEVCQHAVARALYGATAMQGRLPVTVPGSAKRGDGLQLAAQPMTLVPAAADAAATLQPASLLLEQAVRDHVFPGGVLAVGDRHELTIHPFGRFTYEADAPIVREDTIFDVASLTKPVVTTTAIMMLMELGQIVLDAPVSRYLPEWLQGPAPTDGPDAAGLRRKVTVRELLLHTSGLPAHRNYFRHANTRDEILARVFAEPLIAEPGARIEYSDLGFILLGEIITRLTGESLDAYVTNHIFVPLKLAHSMFNPSPSLRDEIPPTENDTAFRHRLLRAEVDDANAFALGGVAGHAGLFSTVGDLAAFAQMILNGGIYAHHRLLKRHTIGQFTRRVAVGDSARALGWDVPTPPSSSGQYFSSESFGHAGFTGASIWIDPARQVFVILLSNRVYPSAGGDAESKRMKAIRAAVHDAVMKSLGHAPSNPPSKP
jgi:beta-glucosidase-like glycosyl hydrolase/CubicO group peptidase (beta-lactamase class C family)